MLVGSVINRLKTRVPALRTVEAGADLAAMLKTNALPQQTPAAHVLPLRLRGGQVTSASALFVQETDELVAVVLSFRNVDRTGASGLADMDDVKDQVIAALAGWGPDDAAGVFRLVGGDLVHLAAGLMIYQVELAITDQLRIPA